VTGELVAVVSVPDHIITGGKCYLSLGEQGEGIIKRPLKKKCRILPAGGLGVSPRYNKSPKIGGLGG